MDYQEELKRQAAELAKQKAQPNQLGVDPAAAAAFGQSLMGNKDVAPVMMDAKQMPEQETQEDVMARLKALMGLGG